MADTVVQVNNLGKTYTLRHQPQRYTALRDVLADGVKTLGRSLRQRKNVFRDNQNQETFWALKDVSFSLKAGEVLGVVGRNGAGKSTLLKLLSRITEPSAGRITIQGRVASLLEVGTGFHPELTGRENVFLNGSILGMSRVEIRKKFDEIVAFAEVERFLDTPVKRYSSGMYMRLAFSVAAHLDAEILVIDEVLAVGDVNFQKKCLRKMEDTSGKDGRSILFVSHNMGAVKSLCNSAIFLEKGQLIQHGTTDAVIEAYLASGEDEDSSQGEKKWADLSKAPGNDEIRLSAVRLLSPDGKIQSSFDPADPITVEIDYCLFEKVSGFRLTVEVFDLSGVMLFASTDHATRPPDSPSGYYRSQCHIYGDLLKSGLHYVAIAIDIPGFKVILAETKFLSFFIESAGQHGSFFPESWPGVVAPRLSWELTTLDN